MDYSFVLSEKNRFFEVLKKEVDTLQAELNITPPASLVEFWEKIGYGFISSTNDNVNRIMDPLSVVEFRLRQGQFEFLPDIEIYDVYEKDKLIFFETDESAYISIGYTGEALGKIYYYNVEIADNLEEFLLKISQDDLYFLDIFQNSISY